MVLLSISSSRRSSPIRLPKNRAATSLPKSRDGQAGATRARNPGAACARGAQTAARESAGETATGGMSGPADARRRSPTDSTTRIVRIGTLSTLEQRAKQLRSGHACSGRRTSLAGTDCRECARPGAGAEVARLSAGGRAPRDSLLWLRLRCRRLAPALDLSD